MKGQKAFARITMTLDKALTWLTLTQLIVNGIPASTSRIKGISHDAYPWNLTKLFNSDSENFYKFFSDITDGMIYNISAVNHDLLTKMGFNGSHIDPIEIPDFNCSIKKLSHVKPTSVHRLTPFDIDVVAAMGDSITAGFGAMSYTLIDLFVEFRGVSWSIGGKSNLDEFITLPNILKKYNPALKGYSLGTAPPLIEVPWEHLNMAVSGSTAMDLLDQAKGLVSKLKSNSEYNFKEDWKVLTIFIGGNDLCSCCRRFGHYEEKYSPQNYIKEMRAVLDYLEAHIPRLFVNVVNAPVVTILNLIHSIKCDITHFIECKCGTVFGEASRNYTEKTAKIYHELLRELVVDSGRYDKKDDFTVVLQPFFDETEVPRNKDGSIDLSYWAPDCFHFSSKAHAASALALWNSMLEPVDKKSKEWKAGEKFKCPSRKMPYFYTNLNSKYEI